MKMRILFRRGQIFSVFFLTCVLTLCGCAFGTRNALLTYQVDRPLLSSPNGIKIHVADFRDDRTDPQLVGHVLNGLGMKTAQVRSGNSVAEWVREALVSELKASGYEVVDSAQGAAVIDGKVVNIDCTSYMTYEGKVGLDVKLKRGNEVILDKTYFGKADEGLNWAMTSKSYAIVLQSALRNVLIQVMSDVDWALKVRRQASNQEGKIP